MSKYYRVLKDTFMWEKGAILKLDQSLGHEGGYQAIDDVFEAVELDGEYISSRIIEAEENSCFFERVYPISDFKKKVFGTRIQAKAAKQALYKGGKK